MDFIRILKFGFSWFGDKETWKYLLAMFGAIIVSFAFVVLAGYSAGFFPAGIGTAVAAAAGIVGGLALAVVTCWLVIRVYLLAMAKAKVRAAGAAWGLAAGFLAMNILRGICILFSVFNPRYLLLGVSAAVLLAAGALLLAQSPVPGLAAIALGMLLLLLYFGVIAHNALRLMLAELYYFREGISMFSALSKSWQLTKGKTSSLLIAALAMFLIMAVAGAALAILFVFLLLGFVINLLFGAVLMFLFFVLRMLVQLLLIGASAYYTTAIYSELSRAK